MNGMWDIDTMEYHSASKKDQNPVTYNSIDEPNRHYANWNKSDRKKTNTIQHHLGVNLKKKKEAELIETENRKVVGHKLSAKDE